MWVSAQMHDVIGMCQAAVAMRIILILVWLGYSSLGMLIFGSPWIVF